VGLREDAASALAAARARSLALLEPLSDDDLVRQHSPLMSPLVWDLAHVGNYEDLWLVRSLGGVGVGPQYDDMYDAFRHPRPRRPALPLLGPAAAREYAAEVRARALEVLDGQAGDELPFAYGMVVQHEHQHDETMLATVQLMEGASAYPQAGAPGSVTAPAGEVLVEGGPFLMGTDTDPWAYDNERPAVEVHVAAFLIDARPVTNAEYAEFIADGGYQRPDLWSEDGWKWRQAEGLEAPQFWRLDGSTWWRRRFGISEPVPLDEPVQHVCWHEACAFAAWAGKRLPTEAEWEKAARSGAAADTARVWEWTSSSFTGYPGFASFPYREYSEVFFGDDYKVLRGGSWATDASMRRPSFRNWDYPIRRQIFSGLRCARDAEGAA
jgi:iron(II)-dependent oxidoreductase